MLAAHQDRAKQRGRFRHFTPTRKKISSPGSAPVPVNYDQADPAARGTFTLGRSGDTNRPHDANGMSSMRAYRLDLKAAAPVSRDGKPLESLTDKGIQLAIFLFQNLGRLLSRDHLLEAIWGLNATIPTRTLDTISAACASSELCPASSASSACNFTDIGWTGWNQVS